MLFCFFHQDAIKYMKKDIVDSDIKAQVSTGPGVKPVSWNGIRYMINEVSMVTFVSIL